MASGEVRVVKRKHPRYKWAVIWYEGGKRKHSYHRTDKGKEGAINAGAVKKRELKHVAPADAAISPEERRAVVRARELGVPLLAAVEAWSQTLAARSRSLPVAELVRQRLAAAARELLSEAYQRELRMNLNKVAEAWGERLATDITVEDAAAWIYRGAEASVNTIRKRRVLLAGLFEFGERLGVVTANPAAKVRPPKAAASVGEIGILSPAAARDYLLAVAVHSPALLPGEAIGLFAGLRRAEIERLDWERIQLDRGHIEVTAGTAKTRTRRLVDIEPALAAILEPLAKKSGRVWPVNSRRLLNRAQKAAGWAGDKHGAGSAVDGAPPWPKNALRHSFVSYHLGLYGDLAATEIQAGHDRKVLFQHYRELVTKEDAEEFWSARLVL